MRKPLRLQVASGPPFSVQALTTMAALLLLNVGCADVERDPVSPLSTEVDPAVASETLVRSLLADDGRGRGIETEYLHIEREVPGFGGLYLDDNLDIVAHLTDLSRTEALSSEIEDRFLTDPYRFLKSDGSRPSVHVVKGEYSMAELVSWQMALIPLLREGAAVTLLDADEKYNRVRVGVRDLVMASEVEERASTMGVPAPALLFVERDGSPERLSDLGISPPRLLGDVEDRIRPTVPGTKITPEDLTPCTMGFNVYTSEGLRYFLTASHCTDHFDGLGARPFYQATQSSGNLVGYETMNPAWDTTGCNSQSVTYCAPADVAAIGYLGSVEMLEAEVAYTTQIGWGDLSGSTAIAGTYPIWSGADRAVGDTVYKTGMTTGTTMGAIEGTCEYLVGNVLELQCAYAAQLASAPGDSGSPMFADIGPFCCLATGIMSGGIPGGSQGGFHLTYYTTWSSVENWLGLSFEFFDPDPVEVEILGPSEVPENNHCKWIASVSGGDSPYSYEWFIGESLVGTSSSYSGDTGTSDFTLHVVVEDSDSRSAWDMFDVTINPQALPCPPS